MTETEMKDTIKFKWEGSVEDEAGLAIYETSSSSYTLRLPNFRSAQMVYTALCDVYQEGYENGVHNTKLAVQSALSKLSE